VVSPSALEALGSCGLQYLYRAGLRIRPPSDPDFDPDIWLDALHRGSLLHRVFERTLRETREAGIATAAEGPMLALALAVLEEEARREEREVPPPGESVRNREMVGLVSDVTAFVAQVVRDGAPWEALELRFGPEAGLPVEVPVPGGTIALRGAVDRVDRGASGLVVVDYKTGGATRYGPDQGVFHGGRRLQHILYTLAVEQIRGEAVEAMVYLFPGRKGRNDRKPFTRKEMESGREMVGALLDLVREGRFLPSDDSGDCRFCAFAAVCRVQEDGRTLISPPADWAKERIGTEPELLPLRRIRQWEDL
jgi:ATP-dependent helicase/nuclease subunit B